MGAAPATAILWPAVAMAGLTFLVWVRLYQLRLGEMARKRIHAQALANAADSVRLLSDTRASDNFRNLFELPVLFYAGVLLAAPGKPFRNVGTMPVVGVGPGQLFFEMIDAK